MPRDDHQWRSIHYLTRHNAQTAALGVSRRLARVCGVVSPVRAPELIMMHVGGAIHHLPWPHVRWGRSEDQPLG
jgi:hypothetical protein